MADDWARTLLADPDLGAEPPSTVDPDRAVRDGRRRTRTRRAGTTLLVAGATTLIVAGVPAMLRPANQPGPAAMAASPAPTDAQPPRATDTQPPASCRLEPLTRPAGAVEGSVFAGDPSGRYAVGVVHRDPIARRDGATDHVIGPATGNHIVLWDNDRPAVLSPPRSGSVYALAVDATGTAIVSLRADDGSVVSWTVHSGAFTELANPGGGYAAVDINARGDIVGVWPDPAGVHPPVVWPAGRYGRPRVLTGGDPGDHVVAFAGGIDDDGTVAGTTASQWRGSSPPPADLVRAQPVVWSPGGVARALPAPDGFGSVGWVFAVRDGIAVGHVERPDPDADRRGNRAAFWDLRTGTATANEGVVWADAVNRHGWYVGRTAEQSPSRPVAVYGNWIVMLPMPGAPTPDDGGAVTMSDDGRTIAGTTRTDAAGRQPVRWRCS